jgi:hypothetical protein
LDSNNLDNTKNEQTLAYSRILSYDAQLGRAPTRASCGLH